MYCNIFLICDSHVTLAKFIRILTSVMSYMHWNIFCFVWKPCSIGWFDKVSRQCVLSNVIKFFSWVNSQISVIILICYESFLTLDAVLFFSLSIRTHMGNEIAFLCERFITLQHIHYLTSVNRVIITGFITNLHYFLDFNTHGCIFIRCNYYQSINN